MTPEFSCNMAVIDHLNPPTGQIADNVVGFARALRAAGIPVGPGAVIDALNALQVIEIGNRADEAFEAYLLEILSDFQVTIPEFGTVKAPHPPIVIITSNRTREIHDALKRRCLYHWVDYPSAERELAIVKSRVPGISAKLSQQVVGFVQALREQDFYKSPGVAETIDWATALTELDARSLTPQMVGDTLGALLKYQDDIARMQGDTLQKVLKEATSEN